MTMNPLDHINGLVAEAVGDAAVAAGLVSREELPGITLEVPKDKSHGDLATNVAMQLTRIARRTRGKSRRLSWSIWIRRRLPLRKRRSRGPGLLTLPWTRGISTDRGIGTRAGR